LSADERLPRIEGDRLIERRTLLAGTRVKKDRVPANAPGDLRDGGLQAVLGPGDLPVRGADAEPGRDAFELGREVRK
jgi:hypothetical protein